MKFPVCLSIAAAALVPAHAPAQWTNAALLNEPSQQGDIKEARLAPAAGGGFHAIYRHFGGGGVEVRSRRLVNGVLRPSVLVHSLEFIAGGEICESGDGSVHVVWENWDDVNEQIWWAKSSDGGLTFPAKQAITSYGTNPNGQAKNPMIVPYGLAGAEVLALNWRANPVNRMHHNRYNGSAFLGNTDSGISTTNSYAAWGCARSPVDGSVWRTYGKEVGGRWQIALRRYDGASWGAEEMVTAHTNDEFPSRGCIAINAAGQLLVAWDAETAVWTRLREPNGAWGAMLRVDDGYTPAITAIPGGSDFYLVHPFPRDSWSYIAGRRWSAGAWSPRVRVSNGIGDNYSPNCDVCADPQGSLYCAWEYWRNGGAGPPESYYSTLTNIPPAVITAPLNGQGILAPGSFTLTAAPGEATTTLTKVEFFQDNVKLGEKTAAPWTWPVSALAAGSYSFHVTGTASGGRTEPSASVTAVIVAGSALTLIPAGATWRYLDNGTDPGTSWTTAAFNDSTWKTGAAQLGYGDGGEATVVEDNPAPGYIATDTNRYITTHFRHHFNVAGPASHKALTGRLLRDDGAAVYLNGMEIFRSNLADGAASTTPALTTVSGVDEEAFYTFIVPPSRLVAGTNVLAVEVHQAAANSSDMGFDFDLMALKANPVPPTVAFTTPAAGAVFGAPASFTLAATVTDDDGDVTRVQFFKGGALTGEDTSAPFTFAVSELPAGTYGFTAIAHDAAGFSSAPAALGVTVAANQPASLVSAAGLWRYLDAGIAAPAGWTAPAFGDNTWKTGQGELGFGDGGETTVINGGPDGSRFMTTYFRHTFSVTQPQSIRQLFLNLLCDDGAVVFLNGSELFRHNMPPGGILFSTPALAAIGGTDEATWRVFAIAASRLVAGDNVLAVEVHQSGPSSSDLSFDLSLPGYTPSSLPSVIAARNDAGVTLTWPSWASGWTVQSSPDLTTWTTVNAVPVIEAGQAMLNLTSPLPGFFRLAAP